MFLAFPAQVGNKADAAVEQALQSGRAFVATKDCPRAIASFQAAIGASQSAALPQERRASVQQEALKQIADCQFNEKTFDQAEATLLRRKQVLREWGAPGEIELGHNALDLASILIERQKWTEAERYAREALATYDAAIGKQTRAGQRQQEDRVVPNEFSANVSRSKVTGLYVLGLSLALQRKPAEALKAWDEGYLLGVTFQAKHETLMQMVIQAIEVHDMLHLTAQRHLWVERLRELRHAEKAKGAKGN